MFALITTFAALLVAASLFYAPFPPGWVPALEALLLFILGFLVLALSIRAFRLRAERLSREHPLTVPMEVTRGKEPVTAPAANGQAAVVQFLARLQEKGRLVDFLMEDITQYDNTQVGAGARVVHQGCREVIAETFDLTPVHAGREGETISLAGDYDAGRYRLTGKVPDRPPFRGAVRHRGWRTARVSLPKIAGESQSAREIVAPAEVEIG